MDECFKIFINCIIGYYNWIAFREKNDCSVYTISTAFLVPYIIAHQFLQENGRNFQRACYNWDILIKDLEKKGLLKRLPKREYQTYYKYKRRIHNMTIGTFIKEHPKGNYIITTSGHVVTIRDGILFDRINSLKYRVQYAHKIK